MFGYVRPFKGEMLVKEYDAYKGVYCQLCRALGKYYGFPMRLTLSYDCTLYALLALNQRDADVKAEKDVYKRQHYAFQQITHQISRILSDDFPGFGTEFLKYIRCV